MTAAERATIRRLLVNFSRWLEENRQYESDPDVLEGYDNDERDLAASLTALEREDA